MSDGQTAIYDISARMVYMPDGTKLEAHSGLGDMMDDPRHVHVKMRGATPPHVYDLTHARAAFPRRAGAAADARRRPWRDLRAHGSLAHTYLLGPNGDSNGCVSFKNYEAFLKAYQNKQGQAAGRRGADGLVRRAPGRRDSVRREATPVS